MPHRRRSKFRSACDCLGVLFGLKTEETERQKKENENQQRKTASLAGVTQSGSSTFKTVHILDFKSQVYGGNKGPKKREENRIKVGRMGNKREGRTEGRNEKKGREEEGIKESKKRNGAQ